MIRFIAGIVMVLGAVGTLDTDPHASGLVQGTIALCGLIVAYSGAADLKRGY